MKFILMGFLIFNLTILQTACSSKSESPSGGGPTPNTSPTPSPGPVGKVDPASFFVLALSPSPLVTIYSHEQSSLTKECKVLASETDITKKDLFCIVDVQELDLYHRSLSLNFNGSQKMCPYIRVRPYWFWNWEPPNGLLSISTTITDGTVSAQSGDKDFIELESDGSLKSCDFDYTKSHGPNCCEGTHYLTTITSTGTGVDKKYNPPVTDTIELGGTISDCIAGPGLSFNSFNGYPGAVDYYTEGEGINDVLKIEPPVASLSGLEIITNYFNPASFGSSSSVFPSTGTLPVGIRGPENVTSGHPFYSFECRDQADDLIARIRVFIRAWDTISAFSANSNPYTSPSSKEPQFDEAWHDRNVWEDRRTAGTFYPRYSLGSGGKKETK